MDMQKREAMTAGFYALPALGTPDRIIWRGGPGDPPRKDMKVRGHATQRGDALTSRGPSSA